MCCRGVTGVSLVAVVLGAGRDRTAALTAGCTLPPASNQPPSRGTRLLQSTEYLLPPALLPPSIDMSQSPGFYINNLMLNANIFQWLDKYFCYF